MIDSTVCKSEIPNIIPPLSNFSPGFQTIIREFNKSIGFNIPMGLTLFPTLSPRGQNLACLLLPTSNKIRSRAKILFCVLSKKVNYDKSNELDFIAKQVTPLIETIICNSSLHLDWDVTLNCYPDCDINVHFNRHGFIIYTNDGIEVGTGEVKPYNASEALVEIDRCRIAESCKKQLHQRLLIARSKKELYTYGIMVYSNQIQLSALPFIRYWRVYLLPLVRHLLTPWQKRHTHSWNKL